MHLLEFFFESIHGGSLFSKQLALSRSRLPVFPERFVTSVLSFLDICGMPSTISISSEPHLVSGTSAGVSSFSFSHRGGGSSLEVFRSMAEVEKLAQSLTLSE